MEKFKFEILIDDIKILAERKYGGHGAYITYTLSFKCTNCDKEMHEWIMDIKSLYKILIDKNICVKCQLENK